MKKISAILLLFLMQQPAFAVLCNFTGPPSPWVSHPIYYNIQQLASQACETFAQQHGTSCYGPSSCAESSTGDCSWRSGYVEYWVDNVGGIYNQNQFLWCANPVQSCSSQRTAASQQCGGDDKYIIDESTCSYACKESCSTSSLGITDSDATVTPLQNCVEQCSQIDGHCGSAGYSMYDGQNCKGTCNPAPDCAQKYEQKSIECKQHIAYWDNTTCTGVCEECEQQYLAKKQECANPVPVYATYNGVSDIDRCKYTCNCTDAMDQSNKDCPYGAEFQTGNSVINPCDYKCLSCEQLADKCVEKCGTKDNVSVYNCEALNTIPSEYMCECKGNDCKSYYDSCTRSCATDECAGVKEMRCIEALGVISYRKCECNGCAIDGKPEKETCSNYTNACANACSSSECGGVGNKQCSENDTGISNKVCECKSCGNKDVDGSGSGGSGIGGSGSGGGGTGTPTPNPSDQSDLTGWLRSIKGNTDDLVRQGEDQAGWLSSIKKNTDTANDYLKTIAGKNTNVSVGGTDVSGVVNAVNNANNTLGDIQGGLSHVGIGTDSPGLAAVGDLGNAGYVTGAGYGSAPTDADLPSAEQVNSAFGTFVPRADGGSHGQIATSLSSLSINTSGPVCGLTLKIPRLTESFSWEWLDFPVDFCPYESMLSAIGSLLVFAAALNELYKFS